MATIGAVKYHPRYSHHEYLSLTNCISESEGDFGAGGGRRKRRRGEHRDPRHERPGSVAPPPAGAPRSSARGSLFHLCAFECSSHMYSRVRFLRPLASLVFDACVRVFFPYLVCSISPHTHRTFSACSADRRRALSLDQTRLIILTFAQHLSAATPTERRTLDDWKSRLPWPLGTGEWRTS